MMGHPKLVPDDFVVPERVVAEEFVVAPLTWRGFPLDFECYMSSVEHLQATYNVDEPDLTADGLRWPEGTTLEMAFLDAAHCERERHNRTSFAYVVLEPGERRQLGCVYVFPCKKDGFDAECRCWVRADALPSGLDERLYAWSRAWLETAWPFAPGRTAWPGREIPWERWAQLPGLR
jgi:hypothetical protein